MEFYGYERPDGRVGIRNKVLILPASVCASDVTALVASRVEGAVSFHNQTGCSQVPSDMQLTLDVLAGYAANPNVYGTVLIGLGCETCQASLVAQEIQKRTSKPLKTLVIQENGGSLSTVERAVRYAREMAADAGLVQKSVFPADRLIVGTECGGSDPTSGLAANPVIGETADRLVELGATVILSETTEFIGAEHILAQRAADEETKERIYSIVSRYEQHFKNNGEDVRKGNPTPGNIAGGITTLEEKSLGCIHKSGRSVIRKVYDYGKMVTEHGLVIMDTPGNDASSLAGMAAGGCQIAVFSTGKGTLAGNPLIPVIKITGNEETYRNMADDIDLNAGTYLSGKKSRKELAEELFRLIFDVASGYLVRSEALGYTEMAIMRACNFV